MIEQLVSQLKSEMDGRIPVQTVWAECVSANAQDGTMTAVREGLEYHDVLLGVGDDITVPEPGSSVLLGLVENHDTAAFLIYAERIALRHINGNAKGGLVVASTVRQTDATLINKVNALAAALNAWTPTLPVPTVADLLTLKAAFATWSTTPIPPVSPISYENIKVKHG